MSVIRKDDMLRVADPVKCLGALDLLCELGYKYNGSDWVKEPKPRTKTVYEKVEYDKLSDLVVDCENSVDIYLENVQTGEKKLTDVYGAISMFRHGDPLFHKLEKEIDWKDELADEAGLVYDKASDSFDMGGKCWGSKWVKEFGHLVAELTDKPE